MSEEAVLAGWYHSDIMRNLLVRNIPDELYEALRAAARREGRSLSAEAVQLLTRGLADRLVDRALVAQHVEERAARVGPGDRSAVEDIREDRDR